MGSKRVTLHENQSHGDDKAAHPDLVFGHDELQQRQSAARHWLARFVAPPACEYCLLDVVRAPAAEAAAPADARAVVRVAGRGEREDG